MTMGIHSKIGGVSLWVWLFFAAGLLSVPVGYGMLSRNQAAPPPEAMNPAYVHMATQKGITAVEHDVGEVKQDVSGARDDVEGMEFRMHKRFNEEDKALREVKSDVEDIRSTVDTQNVRLEGMQQKTDETALEIRQMEAVNAFHQKMTDDRMAQVQYATALSAANTMPKNRENTKPRTFSYFNSQAWTQEMRNLNSWANSVGFFNLVNVGTSDKDAVRFTEEGEVILDGFGYRGVEEYDFANKLPNGVVVLAPGLMELKDDTLQIEGDAKIDTVMLDGCLKWQKTKTDGIFTYWKATDAVAVSRMVQVGNGIQTAVEPSCDNRFLLRRQQKGASKLWEDPTVARHNFNLNDMENSRSEVAPAK